MNSCYLYGGFSFACFATTARVETHSADTRTIVPDTVPWYGKYWGEVFEVFRVCKNSDLFTRYSHCRRKCKEFDSHFKLRLFFARDETNDDEL